MDLLSRLSAWQREGPDKTQGSEAHPGVPQIWPLWGCLSESVVLSLLLLIWLPPLMPKSLSFPGEKPHLNYLVCQRPQSAPAPRAEALVFWDSWTPRGWRLLHLLLTHSQEGHTGPVRGRIWLPGSKDTQNRALRHNSPHKSWLKLQII